MSRIAGIVRGADRKSVRVLRQILDEATSRQSRASVSKTSKIPNSRLRVVDLGVVTVTPETRGFNHSLGEIPTRVEFQPVGAGQVFERRQATGKLLYLAADQTTRCRVRVYL